MKKLLFLTFFFFIGFFIFAQEFDIQWLDNMQNYLGKQIRDIPDEYIQNPHDREEFTRELPNNILEGFRVKNNIIIGVMWVKITASRSTLYSEYDSYKNLLVNRFGKELYNLSGYNFWNWNSRVIVLGVIDGAVGITLILPEAIGLVL
jgi:hypothetical protein